MTEDEDWLPPELVERAKITAERDAATAAKLADGADKKQKRKPLGPPEARNPRFAFVVSGICLLLFLAGSAAAYQTDAAGSLLAQILSWVSAAFSVLIYLKFMLPVLKKHHKLILGILIAVKVLCSSAAAIITSLAETDRTKMASGLVAAALALAISPMFWLLYGIVRRQSSEKRAALIQLASSAILLLSLLIAAIAWLVNRLKGKPFSSDLFTLSRLFNLLHGVGIVFLLMSWPVLDRPAGFEKPAPSEQSATE